MIQPQDNPDTAYPPQIVQEAFILWEQLQKASFLLWKTFSEKFAEIDELRTIAREQRNLYGEDELPF